MHDENEYNTDGESERGPLLNKKASPKSERPPLPVVPLLILCCVRLAEPISYTQIFPYVNEMMDWLKVTDDPAKIGFYSGVVDSIFALAQLVTIYQWSSLSDRIGRKPVILIGLSGVALSSLCFGLSSSFWTAMLSRSLAGMLSGNVAVVSSMLGEMVDERNHGRVFPLLGATWSIGCILGPIIGGTLSYPATRYPDVFGQYQLLRSYPYFLPCLISSTITVSAIIFCSLFVDETLPSIVQARKKALERKRRAESTSPPSTPTSYGTTTTASTVIAAPMLPEVDIIDEEHTTPSKPIPTAWQILKDRAVQNMITSGFMLSFISMGFEVVFVLCAYSRPEFGGLGRSTTQIGYMLSSMGLVATIIALLIFPSLQSRFDNATMYQRLMLIWPVLFLTMPLLNVMVRAHLSEALVWTGIIASLMTARIAGMNFALNMILMKQAAPSADALGATFGLQQTFACLARAMGPAFSSSLYAISVDHHLLGGYLVWFVMAVLSCSGVYFAGRVGKKTVVASSV